MGKILGGWGKVEPVCIKAGGGSKANDHSRGEGKARYQWLVMGPSPLLWLHDAPQVHVLEDWSFHRGELVGSNWLMGAPL